MALGEQLSKLRAKMGISQNEIATRLGIARTTYAGYENKSRNPDPETLLQLANFFGVTVDELLGNQEAISEQSRELIEMLDLSDEEIISKMDFVVDGIKLDPDDIKVFLAIVRAERIRKKQGLALDGNKQ